MANIKDSIASIFKEELVSGEIYEKHNWLNNPKKILHHLSSSFNVAF